MTCVGSSLMIIPKKGQNCITSGIQLVKTQSPHNHTQPTPKKVWVWVPLGIPEYWVTNPHIKVKTL